MDQTALLRRNAVEEIMKKRLELLKRQHKRREYEKRVAFEKERLISEHINFTKYYRFADQSEADRINSVLNGLPVRCSRPDFSRLLIEHRSQSIDDLLQYENEDIWICCLCGSIELINLFSLGKMSSFIHDFEYWYDISDYLFLLFHNFIDFIYIDDNGEIVKSKVVINE